MIYCRYTMMNDLHNIPMIVFTYNVRQNEGNSEYKDKC